jgi:dihydrofolate reductase
MCPTVYESVKSIILNHSRPDNLLVGALASHTVIFEDFAHIMSAGMICRPVQVYEEALQLPQCEAVHLTRIHSPYDCDTVFPNIPETFRLWSASTPQRDNKDKIEFLCYTRPGSDFSQSCLPPGMASKHEELQVPSYAMRDIHWF